MGSKNHEVVPSTIIAQIAKLRHGGAHKLLSELARRNLIAKVQHIRCKADIKDTEDVRINTQPMRAGDEGYCENRFERANDSDG